MQQKIDQLSPNEQQWVQTQLQGARKLVEIFTPEAAGGELSLENLDRALTGFMQTDQNDNDVLNAVINQVGIAFGKFLVEGLGLGWVIATDERGSDLAVYGLPGAGDVLIYPANFVAKRLEKGETMFLEKSYHQFAADVGRLREGKAPEAARPAQVQSKGFLKRWFGKA